MSNKKFRTGDKVRIIDTRTIEDYELNKVGTIVDIYYTDECGMVTYVVDMGRPRRPNFSYDNETCWWLRESRIELVSESNTQLLFDFMNEVT